MGSVWSSKDTTSSSQNPTDSLNTSKCPVQNRQESKCPVQSKNSSCPVNRNNQMPEIANHAVSTEQVGDISTGRVKSTIPKNGGQETWDYPSSQMFYNSLVRKGKSVDFDESELDTIVAVHNNMNERAWDIVMNWEKRLHGDEYKDETPTLNRFLGRPDDLTPKAWIKTKLLGHSAPFDRHDWFIGRSNGTEVRYVIDFYYDEEKGSMDKVPALHDARSIQSISMDARIAVDSFDSAVDRVKYFFLEGWKNVSVSSLYKPHGKAPEETLPTPPANPSGNFSNLDQSGLEAFSKQITSKCREYFQSVQTCDDEESCAKASSALSMCMAGVVCKSQADACIKNPESDTHMENLFECLERFELRAMELRKQK